MSDHKCVQCGAKALHECTGNGDRLFTEPCGPFVTTVPTTPSTDGGREGIDVARSALDRAVIGLGANPETADYEAYVAYVNAREAALYTHPATPVAVSDAMVEAFAKAWDGQKRLEKNNHERIRVSLTAALAAHTQPEAPRDTD